MEPTYTEREEQTLKLLDAQHDLAMLAELDRHAYELVTQFTEAWVLMLPEQDRAQAALKLWRAR